MINISNILTQLNAKMAADIADSYNIPELVRRVEAYQKLNVDAGTVPEYHSAQELPDSDSANIGQIVYVRQKPGSRGDFSNDIKDSAGTFFFGKRAGGTTIGWQKIPLLAGDSDYTDIDSAGASSGLPTTHAQGSISGYSSGGFPYTNTIEKFSFTSDANATDVGNLTVSRARVSGQSSTSSGYVSGGLVPPHSNVIDKFPFSSDANATDVGNLIAINSQTAGQSSTTHGYASGGANPPPYHNTIQKFSFTSDGNATDVGDLTQARRLMGGNSSETSGYSTGGTGSGENVIDKFPFTSDGNATDVGDLLYTELYNVPPNGQVSGISGYIAGGYANPGGVLDVIQKFSFSVDGNSTDVGDLVGAVYSGSGQSSTTHGYRSGGQTPTFINRIEKFSTSTDGNATDVGDLLTTRSQVSGQQV